MHNGRRPARGAWRHRSADHFKEAEHLLYIVVGAALAVAGFVLFVEVVYDFVHDVTAGRRALERSLLDAVNGLLLVFIFAELLHTVRALIAHDELRTEPFVVVAMVAAIRRFIVVSALAAEGAVSDEVFSRLMIELGLLVAAVLVLGCTVWLLRRSTAPAIRPAGEDAVPSRARRPASRRPIRQPAPR